MKRGSEPQPSWRQLRGIDVIVPVAALFVSLISIVIAWYSATVEARMSQQNERMVQATSLPFVQLYSNNGNDHMKLAATNAGVGPARIRSVLVLVNGRPVSSIEELVMACCNLASRAGVARSTISGAMLRAGDTLEYVAAGPGSPAASPLNKLYRQRRIETRVCYCSVFNECWVRSSFDNASGLDPRPVKTCPIGRYRYRN